MKRKIKFRAWNKRKSLMIFSPEISTDDLSNYDEIRYFFWHCEDSTISVGDVILMQFTGLKDKNGREIYEGDTINIYWKSMEGTLKLEDKYPIESPYWVEWDNSSARFTLINKRGCYENGDYYRFDDLPWHNGIDEEDSYQIEVIGNIWENPNLIKVKD